MKLHRAGRFRSWPVGSGILLLLVVGLLVVLLAAQLQTLTYASGTDGMTYMRAANEVIRGEWPGRAGFPYAPGFVYLLAVSMRVGGPFFPYWLNALLFAGTLLLLLWGLKGVLGDPIDAAVVCMGVLAGLAGLFGNSLAFLLLPFREASSFFFIILGYFLILRAAQGAKCPALWMSGAGLSAMLATGIREPSLLAFVRPILFLLFRRSVPPRARVSQVVGFLLPWFLAGIALLLSTTGRHLLFNQQGRGWWAFLSAHGVSALLSRWGTHGIRSWGMLQDMVSWGGLAAFAWGIASTSRRHRPVPAFFGVTAFLLFFFYAFMEAHYRYLLSVQFFMLPLVAMGILNALVSVTCRIPLLRTRRTWVLLGLYGVFFGWSLTAIGRITPMGSSTTARQIRAFRATIDQLPSDITTAAATDNARYALDAILSFTDLQIVNAPFLRPERAQSDSFAVVDPLNAAATFFGGYFPYFGLSARNVVEQYADVLPIGDHAGSGSFRLGEGEYQLSYSRPWSATEVREVVEPGHLVSGLLWLDFRDSSAEALRTIRWETPGGRLLRAWELASGKGLVPFYAGRPDPFPVGSFLIINSTDVLPRKLLAPLRSLAGRGYYALDRGRRLSAQEWILPPAARGRASEKWGAAFVDEAAFRIPVPRGLSNEVLLVSFFLDVQKLVEEDVIVEYRMDEQPLAVFTNSLMRGRLHHNLEIPGPLAGPSVVIEVHAEPAVSGNFYRIISIGVGTREVEPKG